MNRQNRRRHEAIAKKRNEERVAALPTRPDGRIEAYETGDVALQCWMCVQNGHLDYFPPGKVVLVPAHYWSDSVPRFVCVDAHLEKDAVIFNPKTGECRDVTGQNTWRE